MDSAAFVGRIEALSWLERPDGKDRTISEDSETYLSKDDALLLVRELYDAGAVEVLARDVTVEDEFEDASSLLVVLPNDPKKRGTLFAFDPAGEQGQDSFGLGW